VNEKARNSAFELLVEMGKKMQAGGTIVMSKIAGAEPNAANGMQCLAVHELL
jgi:hypothetical protein